MKNSMVMILMLALFLVSVSVVSENHIGVQYMRATYEETVVGDEVGSSLLNLKVSASIFKSLSIEGRIAYSINSGQLDFENSEGSFTADVDVSTLSGIYFKYGLPPRFIFSPYIIAGYSYAEVEQTTIYDNGTRTLQGTDGGDTDASFGMGMDISLSEKVSIGLEYMDYFSVDPIGITVIGLSLDYKF